MRPRRPHRTTWQFWERISPESKVKLAKLYKKLSGEEFVPPSLPLEGRSITTRFEIEDTEEIGKIIRRAPRGR